MLRRFADWVKPLGQLLTLERPTEIRICLGRGSYKRTTDLGEAKLCADVPMNGSQAALLSGYHRADDQQQ